MDLPTMPDNLTIRAEINLPPWKPAAVESKMVTAIRPAEKPAVRPVPAQGWAVRPGGRKQGQVPALYKFTQTRYLKGLVCGILAPIK